MSKKKRKDYKYPAMAPEVNTKSRRDYLCNRYYFDKLPEEAKQYINDFNEMYYINSTNMKYGNEEFVEPQLSKEEIQEIKQQIKVLKDRRGKIFQKTADNTTEEDRKMADMLTEQIDSMNEFLDKMWPTRVMARDDNARKRDFLNMNKAGNMYKLISWETLREDELNDVIDESIYLPNDWEDKDEEK